jgi:hypothetical protein
MDLSGQSMGASLHGSFLVLSFVEGALDFDDRFAVFPHPPTASESPTRITMKNELNRVI